MSESVTTPWERVAGMLPGLLPQASVRRVEHRGERWSLMSNDASGTHHRINDVAWEFIGRLDGNTTVGDAWAAACRRHGDDALSQGEAVQLIVQLEQRELLQVDYTAETSPLFQARHARRPRSRQSLNPFALRLTLGDPARWLARLDGAGQALFSAAGFWAWLALVLGAALVAGAHWDMLAAHGRDLVISPRMLILSWVLYPLIKAVHELAHGVAVRRFGGEVHEFGLGLFMLVPAPYVDASASTRFPRRRDRALVGAAGIMAELAMAALALAVWFATQPGLVHDIAFAVMFIGCVSTLIFNGNPLLRYDGYYVLCDALDLPNLATRSAQYWGWLGRRMLLRAGGDAPQMAPGEGKWLALYAPLSTAYRLSLWLTLVVFLGGYWVVLGAAAFLYMVFAVLLRPLYLWIRQSHAMSRDAAARSRLRVALAAAAVAAGLALFVLPLPHSTVAPAVVWLPDSALVRPEVDGFVRELPVRDGARVKAGTLIALLENDDLRTTRERAQNRVLALQAERFQSLLRDPVAAQNLAQDIARAEAELKLAEERFAHLEVRAGVDGVLSLPRVADLPGQFVRRGVAFGHVLQDAPMRVRAAVEQDHAWLVRHRTHGVAVRLADEPWRAFAAELGAGTPAATRQLPSAALGDLGGGPIAVDAQDKDGTRSLEPVVLYDVLLKEPLKRVGGRAHVRFDHGAEPAAFQLYRRASQVFLKRFDPAA
jgi:putative peptide zinc metalloprotease protein